MEANKTTIDSGEVLRQKFESDFDLVADIREQEFYANLAQQVYDYRIANKLTQREFAKAVGLSQSVISRLENGDNIAWKIQTLKSFGKIMGKRLVLDWLVPIGKKSK